MAASPLLHTLPVGYRFRPSEEELVFSYLLNRTSGQAYAARPLVQLPEVNVLRCDPSSLPADAWFDGEWFFFYRPTQHGSKKERSVKCGDTVVGFWKSTGNDHAVRLGGSKSNSGSGNASQKATSDGSVTGMKKKLVYYMKSGPSDHKGSKTDWIMDEYRLEGESPGSDLTALVLCRVFIKGNAAPPPNAPQIPASFAPASPNMSAATVSRPMSPAPSLTLGGFANHVAMAKEQTVAEDCDAVTSVIQAEQVNVTGAASAVAMGGGDKGELFVDLLLAKDEEDNGTASGDTNGCANDEDRMLLNTMMDSILIDDGEQSRRFGSDDATVSMQLVTETFVDSSVENPGSFDSGSGGSATEGDESGRFGGFQSHHGSNTDIAGTYNATIISNKDFGNGTLSAVRYENIAMAHSPCHPAVTGTLEIAGNSQFSSAAASGAACAGTPGVASAAAVSTSAYGSSFAAVEMEQPMHPHGHDDVTINVPEHPSQRYGYTWMHKVLDSADIVTPRVGSEGGSPGDGKSAEKAGAGIQGEGKGSQKRGSPKEDGGFIDMISDMFSAFTPRGLTPGKGFTPRAFTSIGFTPRGVTPKSGYPFATPKGFSPGAGLWRFPSMKNGKKRPAATPSGGSRLAEDRFVRVKQ
ncbi:hypothetical protein CLOP_g2440 [Closterium sp. NIES-67]|nr:hypothetical protein CLOP_g2440 [Closterium sp. NIES-67]